jgi:hypothetical protein
MDSIETRVLNDEELKAIRDPRDYPIFKILKKIPLKHIKIIRDSIEIWVDSMPDYLKKEKIWLEDAKWYLGEHLNREVKDSELADEILNNGLCDKYRLYYAAKYRPQITVPFKIARILGYLRARLFLHRVDKSLQSMPN